MPNPFDPNDRNSPHRRMQQHTQEVQRQQQDRNRRAREEQQARLVREQQDRVRSDLDDQAKRGREMLNRMRKDGAMPQTPPRPATSGGERERIAIEPRTGVFSLVVAILLIVIWLAGAALHFGGGAIHALLALGVIILIVRAARRR